MKNNKKRLLLLFVLAACSCNVKKFVPEEELLYTGAEVELTTEAEINDLKDIEQMLENVLRPKPNDKILGMYPGLYFHYKAQRENPGFINKFFNKKIGEEPIYASDVDMNSTEELLVNRAENNGFFNSVARGTLIKNEEEKEAKAAYTVKLREPYTLATFKLEPDDSLAIYQDIAQSLTKSKLTTGMRYDLSIFKNERQRIDTELKEKGYYNFQSNLLIFEADTNRYKKRKFDLYLHLKEDLPKKALVPYVLRNVNVYPNYSVETDSLVTDTVRFDQKNFFQDPVYFKPERLAPYILLNEGELYSPENSTFTGRRLSSIGSYKFVNIRYEEVDSVGTNDSIGYLDANIYLSPLNKHALRLELQGVTKSNGFTGPGLAATYSNRNLFKGGEVWQVSGRFSYQAQLSGSDRKGLSSINFGLQTDLIVPRLLFPISIKGNWFGYSIPKTKISLGGDYLMRSQLYSLGSVFASFGYFWNANELVSHELNPIVVNYVSLTNTTPEFEQILQDNPYLQNSFDQEFIAGLTYRFTYNEMGQQKPFQFFVNTNLDIAGNLISLVAKEEEIGPKTLFGLTYAQYAKADVDFRIHYNLDNRQKIAFRLFAGLGLPYGNSKYMPYSKQYFSGGPYSVRAFPIRGLGPGAYSPERENSTAAFFDQTGNIRLEANVEYRFPIVSFLKGAVFADAGNVWNTMDIENLPGGKFESDFLSELGIGIGAGLRVDIQSFVIRFDLAFPMHDPSLPQGERWIYDFGSPVFNFAIGYPF